MLERNALARFFSVPARVPALIMTAISPLPGLTAPERAIARQAVRLAREYQIDLEWENSGCWVTCAKFDESTDPFDNEHWCDGVVETLGKVEAYVTALEDAPRVYGPLTHA